MKTLKEGGYSTLVLVGLTLLVVIAWGIVPALAQMVKMPGGITASLVNAFAALAILVVITLNKSETYKLAHSWKYLKDFSVLGFLWPFLYSIAFFQAIYESNGSLIAIANYMWPLFAMWILWKRGIKVKKKTAISVGAVCLVVAVVLFMDGSVAGFGLPLALGLAAGFLQGYFNVESKDEGKYPLSLVWQTTLVGALVTMIGGAVIALTVQRDYLASITWDAVWPLIVIGAFSNGLGFTAYLAAGKLADIGTEEEKDFKNRLFLVLMSFTPFAQVALALVGRELKPSYLIGAFAVTVVLLVSTWPEKKKQESDQDAEALAPGD